MRYRHCDGKLILKVTDDRVCLKYVTDQQQDLKRVETRLRSINKLAPILQCERSKVSVEQVLNIKGFDLDRTLEMDPGFLSTEGAEHEHDGLT